MLPAREAGGHALRYVVIRQFIGPEGRDGMAKVGDILELPDERGKDLTRWGLVMPEQMIPKPSTVAGPVRRSRLSLAGRRSRTSIVEKQEPVIESSQLTTIGDELVRTSPTPATGNGGTDITES